jgi:diaminohydroxyphosphoribosylaminopyrimidine deaminase/5-amino-6-(5-phosphoribosylamino)uracil reductase
MTLIMDDIKYMKIAFELAKKGMGHVNPNPMVGAVIVKNNKIIGSGYHKKYGELHAERNAFKSCTESPEGATIYVTLEPCCHHGKTPPCTDAIIENKIKSVVIGSNDPNPLVSGKGIKILKEHGISVTTGIMQKECDKLNEIFFHYIKTNTPYVVMKYAMTFDGKIATHTGKSKWITGETAREHVHHSRHRYSAIMVGVDTVIADNPMLNCRIPDGRNPKRIICDTNLRIPLDSQIVKSAKDISTYIAASCEDAKKIQALVDMNCKIIQVPSKANHIDLNALMIKLGEEKIDSVLLEGGSTLNFSALSSGIVSKIQAYVSPKIFGGINAKTPVGGLGIDSPNDAFKLANREITILGDDILIEYEVTKNVHRNY